MIFRNDLLEIEAIEKTALGPDPAAPSSFAPADDVAATESPFVEKLKRLVQQNRPRATFCNAEEQRAFSPSTML
jgi:hypothetical protein